MICLAPKVSKSFRLIENGNPKRVNPTIRIRQQLCIKAYIPIIVLRYIILGELWLA